MNLTSRLNALFSLTLGAIAACGGATTANPLLCADPSASCAADAAPRPISSPDAGDTAPPPISDASPARDGKPEAAVDAALGDDTGSGDAADGASDAAADGSAPALASCLALHKAAPLLASGVYTIDPGTGPIAAYCDMILDGGGWTAFFSGNLGAANVFAHFDASGGKPVDVCADASAECLRHLPASIGIGARLAATCGDAAVEFSPPPLALAYLQSGSSSGWVTLGNVTSAAGAANAAYAARLWTGDGATNLGWILSANDKNPVVTSNTFASSYDSVNGGWDFCNGTDDNAATGAHPRVRLFYREGP